MDMGRTSDLKNKLRRIANETAELPGIRLLAKPLFRRLFQQPYRHGNLYYGVYQSYAQAREHAPKNLPTTYDTDAATRMYRDQIERLRVSDYPLLYWVTRLLGAGERRVFDLGGHIGISYYGFGRYIDYPVGLHWQVHDVPAVVAAGRDWAEKHDRQRHLEFTDTREDADGQQVLIATGVLQYLEYTLPELLQQLKDPPQHVLVNLTPMHPSQGYFTLQNIGFAICPYRVMAVPEFVAGMQALGYAAIDRWESLERNLRVPFEPACTIDRYYGFYFRRDTVKSPGATT